MNRPKTRKKDRVLILSRRDFLKYTGMTGIAVVGSGVVGCDIDSLGRKRATWGFLLADMKKCQGCLGCMLACALVHEGVENLSLSRIQVLQNPYEKWPDDLQLAQCRQCVDPACVAACPVGALKPDPDYGDINTVDPEICIGCKSCVEACPFTPGRAIWNFEQGYSQKCDMCANTPHWKEEGGPNGKKACLEICPLDAIVFTKVIPNQEGDEGYEVNLRGEEWEALGYTTD